MPNAIYSVTNYTSTGFSKTDGCHGNLWNPSSTAKIRVLEYGLYSPGANLRITLNRITTRAAAPTTTTPDESNAWNADIAPISGTVLDFPINTTSGTVATPGLESVIIANDFSVAGIIWVFEKGILVPPGAGLGLVLAGTGTLAGQMYCVWEEGDFE